MAMIVGLCCGELMSPSPEGPSHDGSAREWRSEQQACEQVSDLRDGWQECGHSRQAAIMDGGLVSFGLLQVERRRSAASLARKAPAAMHKLIWRCHPCQERASQ
jgi:hypothetical protein